MRVQLIRKLAEMIDGIDLSAYQPGDVLDLTRGEAALLVAEGWGRSRGWWRRSGASKAVYVARFTRQAAKVVRAADRPRARVRARLPQREADREVIGRPVADTQNAQGAGAIGAVTCGIGGTGGTEGVFGRPFHSQEVTANLTANPTNQSEFGGTQRTGDRQIS